MAHEHQYVCDGCGEVVHGKVRGQFIHRDYIQIKGTVVLQMDRDMKTGLNKFQYLTYANRLSDDPAKAGLMGEELTMCVKRGMPCFEQWMSRRREEINYRREEKRIQNAREIRKQEILSGDEESYSPHPKQRY